MRYVSVVKPAKADDSARKGDPMHEKPKITIATGEADLRLQKFFEEQRAYYKDWADEWDRKLASRCPDRSDIASHDPANDKDHEQMKFL
jgi:hypothetical protein